jgi:ribosome maturation protein Sdo1
VRIDYARAAMSRTTTKYLIEAVERRTVASRLGQNYRPRAIETADQESRVEWFAQNGRECAATATP